MKILFIGCVELSYKVLESLMAQGEDICGVVTLKNSSFNSDFKDLSPLVEGKLEALFLEKNNHEIILDFAKKVNPDVIYCFGWSYLLRPELLALPPKGVIGYHPAALPKNRGRHPLIWALALGLEKSASTFFYVEEAADSGDIVSQKPFDIDFEDDALTLYNKILALAPEQVLEFTEQLKHGTLKRQKQNESEATYWRKRTAADGVINFNMSSLAIYNLVRALAKPYVGASIEHAGGAVPVWKVEIVESSQNNIEPGKVLSVQDNVVTVKTYDKAIRILNHEFTQLPEEGDFL